MPARAARIISQWMNSCRTCGRPARLPTKTRCAVRRQRERRGIDERVVEHEIGVGQPIGRLPREQIGIAGPGADERHEAAFGLRSGHSGCNRSAAVLVSVSSVARWPASESYNSLSASSSIGRRSAIGTRLREPAAPRLLRARHPRVEVLGQEHLERLAHQAGEGRRLAVGRHRDRHAGLLDDGSGIGARAFQVVDGVDEEAPRLGLARDRAVDVGRRRGDDVPDAVDVARLERPADDRRCPAPSPQSRRRRPAPRP